MNRISQFIISERYKKYCQRKLKVVKNFINSSDKILDAGCGGTKHPYCFSVLEKNYNIVGVDLDNSWNKNIIKGDISKLNFNDESFDVVLCLDVLEHIKNWQKAFNELIRVAKSKIIITVPTTENKLFFLLNQFLRKIIGVNNKIFAGHYRDFFPYQIELLAGNKDCSCLLIKIEFATPLLAKVLKITKLRYGGVFILEKNKHE